MEKKYVLPAQFKTQKNEADNKRYQAEIVTAERDAKKSESGSRKTARRSVSVI